MKVIIRYDNQFSFNNNKENCYKPTINNSENVERLLLLFFVYLNGPRAC